MSKYELLSLIIGGLNFISLLFVFIQIRISINHSKKNHEEQRRIKTVDILNNWNHGLKRETRLAEKIVEELTQKQCKDLYNYIPFSVSEEIHSMICKICSRNQQDYSQNKQECKECMPDKNGNYLIDGLKLIELRTNVTSYLNNLEIVAVAWQQAIIDRKIIEEQFSFLYNPGNKSALETYRNVAGGGNSYKVLTEFYNQIKANNQPNIVKKDIQ